MYRILCLLLLLPALACAAPTGSRTVRIIYLGAPAGAPQKLHLFDGSRCQEVELPQMNLSPVYNLPAGPLVLRMLTTPPATPEEVDPKAPKVVIRESVTDLYLLVSPDNGNTVAPVRMQVIDVNSTKFKKGQMLWFNLTPNEVGGQLGTQKLALASNSKAVVDSPASGNEDYKVNLNFRIPGDERLFPLCETKWLHDPRSRTLFFIVAENGSRAPRILGFPDYRANEEKTTNP
jgi:hypothetical protein